MQVMLHRPDWYKEAFDTPRTLSEAEEMELEWIMPQTEGDVQMMLGDLQAMGLDIGD